MKIAEKAPMVHCITNPVTMQDTANVLLAAGGSAIMAQGMEEAEEVTEGCNALLLNTGVPDREKFEICRRTGHRANVLRHPVVLDPVGAGASSFRREEVRKLLEEVTCSIIRCNQAEARVLSAVQESGQAPEEMTGMSGSAAGKVFNGVESEDSGSDTDLCILAQKLARSFSCTALVSGHVDAVSDGERTELIRGGDVRIRRVTGGGCMLSALCALFCGTGMPPYEAALAAGRLWKQAAEAAGRSIGQTGGIGSFHMELFNAVELICRTEQSENEAGERPYGRKRRKRIRPEQLRLYAVTDRRWLKSGETLAAVVEELILNGVSCVQLREKALSDRQFLEEACSLREICKKLDVPLIINDRPDIARLVGADGVHVGASDMQIREARRLLGETYIIGASAHTVEEALAAEEAGADYLGCGAVFGTASKSDASRLPDGMLQKICEAVRIPVVAIGGINTENITSLSEEGADGAAVISALFAARDKADAVRRLRAAIAGWKGVRE